MKNLSLRLITVAIFSLVSVIACKKDKEDDKVAGTFSATLNNAEFTSSTLDAYLESGKIQILGFSGKYNEGNALFMTIDQNSPINTTIAFDSQKFYCSYEPDASDVWNAYFSGITGSHGSGIITNHDKTNRKIEGTFNGVIYHVSKPNDSLVISCKFNTTYKNSR
jgi:hypothetical protein